MNLLCSQYNQELLSLLKIDAAIGTDESTKLDYSKPLALTGATLEYLKCRLLNSMFPTIQVLRIIPTKLCVDVSWKTVMHMTNILDRSDSELSLKLVNLLVHTDWPDIYFESIEKNVFPALAKCRFAQLDSCDYWMCWTSSSRRTHRILGQFLEYIESNNRFKPNSKEYIFISATQKVHFLEKYMYQDGDLDNEETTSQMSSTIYLIRLIRCLETIPFSEDILERMSQLILEFNYDSLGHAICLELKRVFTLQSRLYFHLPNLCITSFAKSFNVIDYMCTNLALDSINYLRIENILKENQSMNAMLLNLPSLDSVPSEMELFDQFTVIRIIRSVICGNHDSANQLAICKRSFRSIETIDGFVDTLQYCVALLFLRWDQLTHVELDRTVESGSESDFRAHKLDSEIDDPPVRNKQFEKQGFVCTVHDLSLILKTLRQAIVKRRHSDEFTNCSQEIRNRFEVAAGVIADAIWRLSLIRTKYDGEIINHPLVVDIKRYMFAFFVTKRNSKSRVSETTDEESDTNDNEANSHVIRKTRRKNQERPNSTLPRRKPKRKIPFGKSDSNRQPSFSHSTENERRRSSKEIASKKCTNTSDESDGNEINSAIWNRKRIAEGRRCVISKMLGSKEHLMTVCMNQGDLKATRQMIKVSHYTIASLFNLND